MNSERPRFDLLVEPWIPVRYLDGTTADVSLRAIFADAERIRELGGELPTQTFALLRLLLAVLYRASYDEEHNLWHDDWATWWTEGLPLDDINDYLDEFADRFDLLHPDRPFFQVAGLHTAKGEVKDTAPLILDLPSNNRLFTTRSGADSMRLPFAEAARWLVNAQAFDASGIKSGAVGDDRVKGGKGYPIGLAWAGLLGGVFAEGSDLRETLLLNFVTPGQGIDADGRTDLPPWEDEDADTAAERAGLVPTGPVRLFTWQSRRIRLIPEGDRVIGCVVANGDALTPQNRQNHEPLTGWRYSEPQSKKAGMPTFMPREHQAGRAFWRGVGAILPGVAGSQKVKDAKKIDRDRFISPPVAQAAAGRMHELGENRRISLRAVGVLYGSNNSVVDEVIDDRVVVAMALLNGDYAMLAAIAESAVSLAEQGVRALRYLAENLDRAAGGEGEGAKSRAEAAAYAQLDGKYREWLARLDGDTDPAAAIIEWRRTAHEVLRVLGAEAVRGSGPAAWAGREIQGALMNAPLAESRFLKSLRSTFVLRAEGRVEEQRPESVGGEDA